MINDAIELGLNDSLVNSLSTNDPLIVVAGHYSLADYLETVSNTGKAEIASFKAGVELVSQTSNNGKSSQLVLLINDIGIDRSKRDQLKADYKIPDNYFEIMRQEGLDISFLNIVFESSVRNKASTLLRKLYKNYPHLFERVDSSDKELCRCVEKSDCDNGDSESNTAYIIKGPNGEKLIVKEGPNPKCNLILATFFNDIRKKFRPQLIVNYFNDIYQNRIHLGIHVGRKILNVNIPFVNIFCDGEKIFLDECSVVSSKGTNTNMG